MSNPELQSHDDPIENARLASMENVQRSLEQQTAFERRENMKRTLDAAFIAAGLVPLDEWLAYIHVNTYYRKNRMRYTVVVRAPGYSYDRARRYPEHDDGTFNLASIIAEVKRCAEIYNARKLQRARTIDAQTRSAEIIKRLAHDHPPSARWHLAMSNTPDTVSLYFYGTLESTEEQARIMLEAYERAYPAHTREAKHERDSVLLHPPKPI